MHIWLLCLCIEGHCPGYFQQNIKACIYVRFPHRRTGRGARGGGTGPPQRFNGRAMELKSTCCSGKTYILLVKIYTLKSAD